MGHTAPSVRWFCHIRSHLHPRAESDCKTIVFLGGGYSGVLTRDGVLALPAHIAASKLVQ